MKQVSRFIMFLACSLLAGELFAQGTSLVVFSGHGEKFTMEVKGRGACCAPSDSRTSRA